MDGKRAVENLVFSDTGRGGDSICYNTDEDLDLLEESIVRGSRGKRARKGEESDSDFMDDKFKEIREKGIKLLRKENVKRRRMELGKKGRTARRGRHEGNGGRASSSGRKNGVGGSAKEGREAVVRRRSCPRQRKLEAIQKMSSREAVESLNKMFNVPPVKVGEAMKCAPGIPYRFWRDKKKGGND